MDSVYQPTGVDKPTSDRGSVTLELLLDTLAALSGEVAELSAPLPLFASELESGLAGFLGANDGS